MMMTKHVNGAYGVWNPTDQALPKCDMTPNTFGVQVLIWPPMKEDGYAEGRAAFYGCRVRDTPGFYLYGREIHTVTHWMVMPSGPTELRFSKGDKVLWRHKEHEVVGYSKTGKRLRIKPPESRWSFYVTPEAVQIA
jgi:hypothetical protein